MPTVSLRGHSLAYPVADVLRLFFGPLNLNEPDRLQAGAAQPMIESCLIEAGDAPDEPLVRTLLAGVEQASVRVPANSASREIKRQLYQTLARLTGDVYPWGSLTGIRPTLIAAECLARLQDPAKARQEMTDRWFVAPEKADLALATAAAEAQLLADIPAGSMLVYIGVPFCPSRCDYCSFITQDALHRAGLLEPYVAAMIREATELMRRLPQLGPISAVYLGGGTPTSLPDRLFSRMLQEIVPNLLARASSPDCEFTVEAGRPDTITPAKLASIRQAGATRLCINPQTFHDETLRRIGRRHTAEDAVTAFRLAREMGFGKINMDLIAGLPGETPADFSESLESALALGAESITLHTLALKRSSRLAQNAARKMQDGQEAGLEPSHFGRPDPSLAAMLVSGRERLAQAGLQPYYLYRQKDVAGGLENTGFARPGAGCLYNVGMMSDRRTVIGLGSGAMTKLVLGSRVERLANPRDIADYVRRIDEIIERKTAFLSSRSPRI